LIKHLCDPEGFYNEVAIYAAALAGLAGYGGSNLDTTPSGPTIGQLENQTTTLQAVQSRITNQTITSVANMPTADSSTFKGGAVMFAERGAQEINLIVDSSLTVNF
jgi:hypothetical protein